MTVPLDDVNDIRELDAAGVPRAEIARRLRLSRNTVAKYADMADLSPAAPEAKPRVRRALAPDDAAWIDAVLEADLGAPRKQRHTAKRIYDRLVAERGYEGSYSTVQRRVHANGGSPAAPPAARATSSLNGPRGPRRSITATSRQRVAGGSHQAARCLLPPLQRPHMRFESQRSGACAGASQTRQIGQAPAVLVLDNATEAGRMSRGEVTESRLFILLIPRPLPVREPLLQPILR